MFEAEHTPMAKLGVAHPSVAMFLSQSQSQPQRMPTGVRTVNEPDLVALVMAVVAEGGLQFTARVMTAEWWGRGAR